MPVEDASWLEYLTAFRTLLPTLALVSLTFKVASRACNQWSPHGYASRDALELLFRELVALFLCKQENLLRGLTCSHGLLLFCEVVVIRVRSFRFVPMVSTSRSWLLTKAI